MKNVLKNKTKIPVPFVLNLINIYVLQVVDGFKNNEEQLKKYVEEYKFKLSKSVI